MTDFRGGGSVLNITPLAAVAGLSTGQLIAIILIAVLIVAAIFFIRWANKQSKQSEEAQRKLAEAAQLMSLLVIDKKRMKITEAGLPKIVVDGIPKRMRRSRVPIVKAKVGPQIRTFMCDADVFETIPVKKEIKAMVGGIYITSVKSVRGGQLLTPQKKTFWQRVKTRYLG